MWTSGLLEMNETLVIQQRGVRLYDGDDKVYKLYSDFRAASQLSVTGRILNHTFLLMEAHYKGQ